MADPQLSDPELTAHLQDERFSRKFELPLEPDQSTPFCVTYSDFGYRDEANPQNERVLLYCGPLFGSRFPLVAKDELAKRYRVRIICLDRPGFGGTPNVDLADRVNVWLKIVPALLQHLGIKRVSLASHSGGVIYAFNTMLYLRHILHPTKPYVALCAPWVHPSHSGVLTWKLASNLPSGILNQFGNVAGIFNTKIQPVMNFSSGLSSGLSSGVLSSGNKYPSVSEGDAPLVDLEERLAPMILKRGFSEIVQGLSSDAMLLLKSTDKADIWGPWIDHDSFVPLLAESEARMIPLAGSGDQTSPLKIEVFFSEKDAMIGTTAGPKWFDECWRAEQRGDRIEYSSRFVDGTDHENIMMIGFGVVQQIFSSLPEHGD